MAPGVILYCDSLKLLFIYRYYYNSTTVLPRVQYPSRTSGASAEQHKTKEGKPINNNGQTTTSNRTEVADAQRRRANI